MLDQNKSERSYARVEDELRQRIVRGELGPGDQLPRREEMERQFVVGMPTVQRALSALIRDGFVRAQTGMGTFVADRPPHLFQFAMVFPDPNFASRFYGSLGRAGEASARARGVDLTHYFHHDASDHERLINDVRRQRLAGAIFVHPQWDLWESPAMTTPGLPRVIIAGDSRRDDIPVVEVDTRGFYTMAVERLLQQGCKKIAALIPEMGPACTQQFLTTIRAQKLESRPYWACVVASDMKLGAVSTATRLLMELGDDKRPDGLVIVDDNMLEAAVSGVMASPVRVPDQLRIVTHCNFPQPAGGALPVTRLGFDCSTFMDTAMERLAGQRAGVKQPMLTLIEPVYESGPNEGVWATDKILRVS